MKQKPRLSFGSIFNMSFGFLGIQFGWGLQLANMSAIYTYLGANPDDVPILWLAGPVTGLLIQPIIGAMSDRTWNRLGRRRPYFLVGAIFSSIALFFMPDSPALWIAASLLWILDASINVSMEPFRAFVADKLNADQRTAGFVMQSFFIGIGATLANALPWLFARAGVTGSTPSGIPLSVQYSFKIGAAAFLLAVLYTVLTTREYPPDDIDEFQKQRAEAKARGGLANYVRRAVGIERDDNRSVGKLIAGLSALFVLIAYFLPWIELPGGGSTFSGRELSNGEHSSLLVIPVVAALTIALLAASALSKQLHSRLSSVVTSAPLVAGLLSLGVTLYVFSKVWDTGVNYEFGLIACLAASLILAFGWLTGQSDIYAAIGDMPVTLRQLAVVQFFTWLGLFCMWMFFGLMTSYHVFDAPNSDSPLFRAGNEWGGLMFAVYSIVCFLVAFLLPKVAAATSRKSVHALALTCGGLGLLATYFFEDKNLLIVTMIGVGIAWASILSMPYAILAGSLPAARMGLYMGVFNFFIVIPEIVASFTFGPIIRRVFGEGSRVAPLYVVMAGGVFLLLAALSCLLLVREPVERDVPEGAVIRGDEHEAVLVQQNVQPVPSTGLIDEVK